MSRDTNPRRGRGKSRAPFCMRDLAGLLHSAQSASTAGSAYEAPGLPQIELPEGTAAS